MIKVRFIIDITFYIFFISMIILYPLALILKSEIMAVTFFVIFILIIINIFLDIIMN